MPTSLQLTSAQISQLNALRTQALGLADAVGAWTPFYQYLAQAIRNTVLPRGTADVTVADVVAVRSLGLLPADQLQSMTWLMGGAQVNSDSGAFSKIIREYNIREGELRGKSFSATDLQRASNEVGKRMAEQILDAVAGGTNGKIPTVLEIGEYDLKGVRNILYPGNEAPGTLLNLNQAWPGILMLGKQGQNFLPYLVASGGDPTKADTLIDFQDMLFPPVPE